MKHTKGPWEARKHLGNIAITAGDEVLAITLGYRSDGGRVLPESREEAEDNASLMASAPELYKFVKCISDDEFEDYRDVFGEARDIIEKIEGGLKS